MLLQRYLEPKDVSVNWLLRQVKVEAHALSGQDVIHYPDNLIYTLAKVLEKYPSELFYELLHLESIGQIRRAASDYSLRMAIENEAMHIFIPIDYQNEPSKFLTEVLIEKDLFEPDLPALARFNLIGKGIYKLFLAVMPNSEAYERIAENLTHYFVLTHDKGGTILCHERFNEPRRL